MATFSELQDGVYTITNRPDLVNETTVALRKALFKLHMADLWKQDIASASIDFSLLTPIEPNVPRWLIPISTFVRHRRPKNLRIPPQNLPWSWPQSGNALFNPPYNQLPVSGSFEYLTEDNIFDSYNIEKPNYFYLAGSSLYIKAAWKPQTLDYFYYQYPLFSSSDDPDNITSWIADQFQDAVIEEAAGAVFKAIGKDDEAALYRNLFGENLQLLKQADIGEN